MPTTYNGIGTHYYGRRNPITRDAACPHCHRGTRLVSYDTTLFFVVVFIPIIPLAKKRIIDQCSSCTRHFAVPLKQYHESRARDYAEADRLMAAAKTEKEAAQAVGLVLQYRDPAVIYRLIREGESRAADTGEWSAFLIEVHRFLSRYADAEAAAVKSLAVREDASVRESLAEFQFARDDIDAGRVTLEPLLNVPAPGPSNAVRMGVEALQRRGRHREALELLSRVAIPNDAPADVVKLLGKMRAASEKTLAKSLADPEKFETEADGMIVRRKRGRFVAAKWAAAAAALAAFVYGGYSIYLGTSRAATLVNGTDVAYTATIDGRPYVLQAHEWRPIRVSEGDIRMSIAAPGYTGVGVSSYHFATPFWRRPLDRDALVLNPDGLASVVTSEVTYGPASGSGRPDTLQIGDVGYRLPSIDYAFADPPASITRKSNESAPRYTVAFVNEKQSPANAVAELRDRHDESKAAPVARASLAWPISDADEVDWIIDLLGPDETIAALAPRVALRPLEREAHRVYQNLREAQGDQAALVREYETLLAGDPENGTLIYLLARTRDEDPEGALKLYRQAQTAKPPEPMGFLGESYLLSTRGDYEPALTAMRAAVAAMPKNLQVRDGELELMMATGRHAEVLNVLDATPPGAETPGDFRRRLQAMAALGRAGGIDAAIAARKTVVAKQYGAEGAAVDERVSQMTAAYLKHDERGFADACPVEQVASLRFAAAISRRDLREAERLLADDRTHDLTRPLLVYLAADTVGDADAAARALANAIATGRKGTVAAAAMARWLAGERVPSEAELRQWPESPASKSAAFAALANARPELRPMCTRLAERFGYAAAYPHELVVASLKKPR